MSYQPDRTTHVTVITRRKDKLGAIEVIHDLFGGLVDRSAFSVERYWKGSEDERPLRFMFGISSDARSYDQLVLETVNLMTWLVGDEWIVRFARDVGEISAIANEPRRFRHRRHNIVHWMHLNAVRPDLAE